jgi:hypothetical protein
LHVGDGQGRIAQGHNHFTPLRRAIRAPQARGLKPFVLV